MTVAKPSSRYGRSASATSVGAPSSGDARSHRRRCRCAAMQRAVRRLGRRAVSRRTIGKLMVFSIVAMSRPTSAQCSARMSSVPLTSSSGPARVPGVGPQRDGPERLLRPGAADQDRQVRLDRARRAQRVVERVEAALVAEPLAVEQAAHEHHRLVEPVEPLARARRRTRSRSRRARARTRRRRCRARPGRPRGGRASWRAWR